jgi:hypothetical protein
MWDFIYLTQWTMSQHNINDRQAAQFLRIQESSVFKKSLTFHTPAIL